MILIADSGGSKVNWVLVENPSTQKVHYFNSIGLNIKILSEISVLNILEGVFNDISTGNIRQCFFYGAGISDKVSREKMHNLLRYFLPQTQISVAHDLLGAARAGLKSQPGNVLILGTGSNSAYYDGSQITQQMGGHGYLFGDEASGAWFGKQFFSKTCLGRWPELEPDFWATFQKNYTEYRNCVYHSGAPNAALAAIFPWLLKHKNNLEIKNLFQKGIQEFISKSIIAQKRDEHTAVIGSVGFFLQDVLAEILQSFSIHKLTVIQNPLTELIDFHKNSKL